MDCELQAFYDDKYHGSSGSVPTVRITTRPTDRHEAALATLARRVPTGARVLEVGSGDGRIGLSLLEARPDLEHITLTEVSKPRLDALRDLKCRDARIRVEPWDAERHELKSDSLDVVVMVALVEHLVDPLSALSRLRNGLRAGGFVYIDTPNIAKWTRRLKLLLGKFPSTASKGEGLFTYEGQPVRLHDEGHLHYFTFRSLTDVLIGSCGYRHVERVPYTSDRWLPAWLGAPLALGLPSLFSEVAVIVFR